MKRLLATILLFGATLVCALHMDAQKFGVMGGATFSSIEGIKNSSMTGWNAGITLQFKLPLGFSIQPSLMYNNKASKFDVMSSSTSLSVGYLELPVSFQWGPDLLIFRPFIDFAPYVGYALTSDVSASTLMTNKGWKTSYLQRLAYGVGLGGGIEVWRFQVLCRYNWNLGPLFNDSGKADFSELKGAFEDRHFGGVTLSVAFLFGK